MRLLHSLFWILGFGSVLSIAFLSADENESEKNARAFISFRIAGSVWESPERFETLLNLFDKYPGATDEITFFTDYSHTPTSVEEFEKRLAVMKERIAESKKRGYRSGINILCTIGHHPEALSLAIGPEYPRAIALDGRVTAGTLCMNQPIFRARVKKIYTEMAEADPDYIWIDDDIRAGHGITSVSDGGNICFCDTCMKRISAILGEEVTREQVAARMGEKKVLAAYHQSVSDSINDLFALIEQTVHAVRPGLPLGFMTGERYTEGYDFTRWAKTLAGPDKSPVYWRPGGGYYEQVPIIGMTGKSHEIGRQVSLLPSEVQVIESEIENFPYAPLQKSRHITALEAASHIAAGCTGAAFNVVTMNHEPIDDYEPLIAELARWRPFYDMMVKKMGRYPTAGIFPVWKRTDADNPAGNAINYSIREIAEIGLPIAYSDNQSPVVLLSSGYLNDTSPKEADEFLSRGVYTDVPGVCVLNNPTGLGKIEFTGIEWGSDHDVDSIEKYSDDPINGEFAGIDRDQRQSFWQVRAYGLHLTDPAARSLARLIDYSGQTMAETSMAVFENRLGGRMAVAGYHPWDTFFSRPKATQMKRLFRWLSKDQLVAWVDSFERGNLWARVDDENHVKALAFLNATFDAAEHPALMVRTPSEKIMVYDRFGNQTSVTASETDGPYRRFVLPVVGPWEIVLVAVE